MQTLTTAMGPLIDITNPQCPRSKKPSKAWYNTFTELQSMLLVTVLSQPPLQRYHPSGQTSYVLAVDELQLEPMLL
ncbi:hypothetical protein TOPH_05840 [Tolypocladium ophioglossoides CBS 100239]|uniref:Uncharacterized protein n=1 Tax=Tolypocladium ophioglossoides (strain CBS 100239) TaxID=1163406 RepID=A0A0L0N6U3_TOLOC|nr:hypothetical protein TOPH_05840 [Tolypocladium ophioglossoides CBS 100239]